MEIQIIKNSKNKEDKKLILTNSNHGTEQLHYAFFDIHESVNLDFTAHWHQEYEIILLMDDYIDFLVDGTNYHLRPAEALLLHAGAVHGHADPYFKYGRYVCFSFGQNFLFPDADSHIYNQVFKPFQTGQYNFTKHIKGESDCEKRVLNILHHLITLSANIPRNALSIQIELLKIINMLTQEHAFEKRFEPTFYDESVMSSLRFMKNNFSQPIRISELASALNISPDHFSRIFKTFVGFTPKEYILNLRIQNAIKEMNNNPDCKLSEIAHKSGFSDPNYFSRAFKTKMGVSPSEYLRIAKKDS